MACLMFTKFTKKVETIYNLVLQGFSLCLLFLPGRLGNAAEMAPLRRDIRQFNPNNVLRIEKRSSQCRSRVNGFRYCSRG